MSPRVSLTVGARVYAVRGGEVVAVQLLDRAPSGWWATVEGKVDGAGRAIVESFPTKHLHASRSAAAAVLAAPSPATKGHR